MDRDIPAFNRPIVQRMYAKNLSLHQKRLQSIKSGTTGYTKNLTQNYHNSIALPSNIKGYLLQQEKKTQIQKQNAKLFTKMKHIMNRPDPNNNPLKHQQYPMASQAKVRLSMQFNRINEQNKNFYHRLQSQKPTIDLKKLEQQRKKNLNILKFLGKYPNAAASRITQDQGSLTGLRDNQRTFDARTRRTNNSLHQHNSTKYANTSYGQVINPGEEYAKFKNQISKFDSQIRQMKTYYAGNATQNQKTNTGANFFPSPHRNNNQSINNAIQERRQKHQNDGNRRKFLSQGTQRRSYYNQFQHKNTINQQPRALTNQNTRQMHIQKPQQQQPYPYHLNNPSHNMIIEDRKRRKQYQNFSKNQITQQLPQEYQQQRVPTNQRKLNNTVRNHKINQFQVTQRKIGHNAQIGHTAQTGHTIQTGQLGYPQHKVSQQSSISSFNQFKQILLYKCKTTKIKIPSNDSDQAQQDLPKPIPTFQVTFYRLQDHYRIQIKLLSSFQMPQFQYFQLLLTEDQGTQFLSHMDYDYKTIVQHMLKIQKQDQDNDQDQVEVNEFGDFNNLNHLQHQNAYQLVIYFPNDQQNYQQQTQPNVQHVSKQIQKTTSIHKFQQKSIQNSNVAVDEFQKLQKIQQHQLNIDLKQEQQDNAQQDYQQEKPIQQDRYDQQLQQDIIVSKRGRGTQRNNNEKKQLVVNNYEQALDEQVQ